MPVVPIDVTAGTCFDTARMFLNDHGLNTQLWDDPALMPMMYQAHLELQAKLKSRASPVMKGFAYIIVPAFVTILGALTPNDLTSPIKLWEAPLGSVDGYMPMTEANVAPINAKQDNHLIYWMWSQDQIYFVGSTLTSQIVIYYWRRIPVPTTSNDVIGIIDGEQYLAPRIAALAAGSVGEEATASIATALAESQLQIVLNANRSRAPQNTSITTHP